MVWLWSDSLCSTIVMDHTGDTGITTWILCLWVAHRARAALFGLRWRFMSSYIYLPIWLQSVCHITHFSAHSTSDPYRWLCAWCNLGVLLEKTFFVSNGTMMFSVPSAFVSQILGLRVTNFARCRYRTCQYFYIVRWLRLYLTSICATKRFLRSSAISQYIIAGLACIDTMVIIHEGDRDISLSLLTLFLSTLPGELRVTNSRWSVSTKIPL